MNSSDQVVGKLQRQRRSFSVCSDFHLQFYQIPKWHSTFCSRQDRITLKYCWCPADSDVGGEGVLVCATAVMKNNKPDGICFCLLHCFLICSPLCQLSFSLSDFEFVSSIHGNEFACCFWRFMMNDMTGLVMWTNDTFMLHATSWSCQSCAWYLLVLLSLFISSLIFCLFDRNKPGKGFG